MPHLRCSRAGTVGRVEEPAGSTSPHPTGLERAGASARSALRSRFFKEFLGFGGSTLLEQASRLLSNLAAAAVLGPTVWGTWYLLNLVLRYGTVTQFGVINGMNRQVPLHNGKGEHAQALAVRSTSLGFLTVSNLVICSLAALGAVLFTSGTLRLNVVLTLLLLITQQLVSFTLTSLKASTSFGSVSRLQVLTAVSFPLTILGAWRFGLPGFIAAQAAVNVLIFMSAALTMPSLYRMTHDWPAARALIGIGLPIMLVGIADAMFSTVDRWVISSTMGVEPLGVFSLAIMATSALGMLPQVISQQTYPRIAFAWAARGSVEEIRSLASRQRVLSLVLVAAIAVPTFLLAPWGVTRFLPEFESGVPALRMALAVPLVACVGQGYGAILHVLGRQTWYLLIILACLAVNVAASLLLARSHGLVGVALATVIAYGCLAIGRVIAGTTALRSAADASPLAAR